MAIVVSRPPRTLDDVRAAFDTRSVLNASRTELEELLTVVGAETIDDPAGRARVREMGETMRQLLENRRADELRRPSKLATVAVVLAVVALLCSGALAYRTWRTERLMASLTRSDLPTLANADGPANLHNDARTNLTIAELAKRAPNIRTGTLQAWWAGEQARQVQRLEAQAKRQALAGDRDGAVRTVNRADAIRSKIPALVDFEKPPTR